MMSVAEFFIAYVGTGDPFQNEHRAYPPALIAAAAVVYIGYSAGDRQQAPDRERGEDQV